MHHIFTSEVDSCLEDHLSPPLLLTPFTEDLERCMRACRMQLTADLGEINVKAWGVAVTHYNKEDLVLKRIIQQGQQAFLPKYQHEFIRRGRRVREDVPLFSSYVFFVIDSSWRSLFSIRGLVSIIMTGTPPHPATVRPNVIRELWLGYTPEDERQTSDFAVGQSVKPKTGPFAKFTGTYNGLDSKQREVVLFMLFGREHAIAYDIGDLIAA